MAIDLGEGDVQPEVDEEQLLLLHGVHQLHGRPAAVRVHVADGEALAAVLELHVLLGERHGDGRADTPEGAPGLAQQGEAHDAAVLKGGRRNVRTLDTRMINYIQCCKVTKYFRYCTCTVCYFYFYFTTFSKENDTFTPLH